MPSHWTPSEVRFVVDSYLSMLVRELNGQACNKSHERRRLLPLLDGRSETSIEFKHQNISAVLLESGYPSIVGYKPMRNYQRSLADEVERQIVRFEGLDAAALGAMERPAIAPPTFDLEGVLTAPPAFDASRVGEHRPPVVGRRDYLAIEARNRSLGLAGERFVLEYERRRLRQQNRSELARRVEHVAQERGDGAGFDILSFDSSGRERYVDVKATSYRAETPFYISRNEVSFARENPEHYRLARVYDFRRQPRLFNLDGNPGGHCRLDPENFRATLGR